MKLLLWILNNKNHSAVDRTTPKAYDYNDDFYDENIAETISFFSAKRRKNYVNIIGTYLSGWAGNGGNLPETEASENHRNAHHRNCVGTVCVGFPGSFHFVNFSGSAEDGIDHYTAESRIIAGPE